MKKKIMQNKKKITIFSALVYPDEMSCYLWSAVRSKKRRGNAAPTVFHALHHGISFCRGHHNFMGLQGIRQHQQKWSTCGTNYVYARGNFHSFLVYCEHNMLYKCKFFLKKRCNHIMSF